MDREIWTAVMVAVRVACRRAPKPKKRRRGRRATFPNWLIVAMYLWAAWHDRCLSWACDRDHYGRLFRPRKLPSVSQFARRVRSDAVQAILLDVHRQLLACGVASELGFFDGKPLTVGPASKDPDAARGHVTGGFAKGYKLHAYVNEHRRVVVWSVMPLNWDEKLVALELVDLLPPDPLGCTLDLADSNYDAAPLHKALDAKGRRLFVPLRAQQRVKPEGHHPVTLRQMGPARREAVDAWRDHPDLCAHVLDARNNVEGVFSVLVTAGGLAALPAFVRRLERVRRYVGAKIILYHARLLAQERAQAQAEAAKAAKAAKAAANAAAAAEAIQATAAAADPAAPAEAA
jgi:hypothetical protein